MTVYQAALKAGIRSRTRMAYALRRRWDPKGHTALSAGRTALLTEEELIALAGVLMATEDEKEELIILGLKEYMTPRLRDYYDRIERQYVAQRVHDQKPPPRIKLRK